MRLAIGTVQFGVEYGISNSGGKTPAKEAQRILKLARSYGIDTLDTAAAYGDCEQVLGRIGVAGWNVVSKIPPLPNETSDGRGWVLDGIRRSLARLGIKRLDGLLLHNPVDLLKVQGRAIMAGLKDAKALGLVNKVGYSIYTPQVLAKLLDLFPPDLIQAPFNVFDQRLANTGWLTRLAETGVEIHVRSVFMQGLLLMDRRKRPPTFGKWPEVWSKWDAAVGGRAEVALAHCLGFAKSKPDISRIVVGVESEAHLEQLLAIWEKAEPFDATEMACDDPKLVDPSKWEIKWP